MKRVVIFGLVLLVSVSWLALSKTSFAQPNDPRGPHVLYIDYWACYRLDYWSPSYASVFRGAVVQLLLRADASILDITCASFWPYDYEVYLNDTLISSNFYNIWEDNPYYEIEPGVYNVTVVIQFPTPRTNSVLFVRIDFDPRQPMHIYFFDDEPRFLFPLSASVFPIKILSVNAKFDAEGITPQNEWWWWMFETYILGNITGEEEVLLKVINATVTPLLGILSYAYIDTGEVTAEFSTPQYAYVAAISVDSYRWEYTFDFYPFLANLPENAPPEIPFYVRFMRIVTTEDAEEYEGAIGIYYSYDWILSRGVILNFQNLSIPWVFSDGVSTYEVSVFPKVLAAGFMVLNPVNRYEALPNLTSLIVDKILLYGLRYKPSGRAFLNGLYSSMQGQERWFGFNAAKAGYYNLTLFSFVETDIGDVYAIEIRDAVKVKAVNTSLLPLPSIFPFSYRVAGTPTTPVLEVEVGNTTVRSLPLVYVLPNLTIKPNLGKAMVQRDTELQMNIAISVPLTVKSFDWGYVAAVGADAIVEKSGNTISIQVNAPSLVLVRVPAPPAFLVGPDGSNVSFITASGSYYLAFNATTAGTYTLTLQTTEQPSPSPSLPPPAQPPSLEILPSWMVYVLVVAALLVLITVVALRHAIVDSRKFVRRRVLNN